MAIGRLNVKRGVCVVLTACQWRMAKGTQLRTKRLSLKLGGILGLSGNRSSLVRTFLIRASIVRDSLVRDSLTRTPLIRNLLFK